MADLFLSNQGVVKRISIAGALASVSSVSMDPAISFDERKVIVTQIGIREGCNVAITPTMGKLIYIHPFEDTIGNLVISGLAFSGDCRGRSAATSNGFARIRSYFHEHKLSRREESIKFIFGGGDEVLEGYLRDWQGDMRDTETRMFAWSMGLFLIPANEDDL